MLDALLGWGPVVAAAAAVAAELAGAVMAIQPDSLQTFFARTAVPIRAAVRTRCAGNLAAAGHVARAALAVAGLQADAAFVVAAVAVAVAVSLAVAVAVAVAVAAAAVVDVAAAALLMQDLKSGSACAHFACSAVADAAAAY